MLLSQRLNTATCDLEQPAARSSLTRMMLAVAAPLASTYGGALHAKKLALAEQSWALCRYLRTAKAAPAARTS
jgi:hypothetical protein